MRSKNSLHNYITAFMIGTIIWGQLLSDDWIQLRARWNHLNLDSPLQIWRPYIYSYWVDLTSIRPWSEWEKNFKTYLISFRILPIGSIKRYQERWNPFNEWCFIYQLGLEKWHIRALLLQKDWPSKAKANLFF